MNTALECSNLSSFESVRDEYANIRTRALKEGMFGLGESYLNGDWHSDQLDETLYRLMSEEASRLPRFNAPLLRYLMLERVFNRQSGARAFEIGQRHYDLGNDLFQGMLDSSMSYTCGLWSGAHSLDQAQEHKLERLCQQLHLSPGMHVLDIGCGFGNFAFYAASKFGVRVTGLTVSEEQAKVARARCAGLPVEVIIQDYSKFSGKFDRIVSIEMIEAVGRKNLRRFFNFASDSLNPGGRFAMQVISGESFKSGSSAALDQYLVWLVKHIFPNGYIPSLEEITALPQRCGLQLQELANFGADYDRTLQAWRSNFEAAWPTLAPQYGERFRRMWQYYLNGCMACFRSKLVHLYQVTYVKQ